MPSEFPPPSRRTKIVLAAIAVLTLLYSLIIAGQILLWFVLVGIAVALYLTWLLIVAVFRLVEAVERIATAAEVDSGIRDSSEAGFDPPSRRNSDEMPADDAPDGPQAAPDPDVGDRQDDAPAKGDSDDDPAGDDSADGSVGDGTNDGSVGDGTNDGSASDDSDTAPTDEDRPDRD